MVDEGAPSLGTDRHILTVSVEEFFHAGALQGAIRRKHWDRFESRLERQVDEVLSLFDRHGATATFFVLGCVADRHPGLLARIARAGHEVAASSYWPHATPGMLPDEFREEVERSLRAIESATGRRVLGYRAPRTWLTENDLWVLDVLAEEGLLYDSSINPVGHRFRRHPHLATPRFVPSRTGAGGVWEFPISSVGLMGWRLPVTGGNYARQLPHGLLRRLVARLARRSRAPLVFYFMPWELDAGQPVVTSLSRLARLRHYRHLGKTRAVFEDHLCTYRFQSVAGYLAAHVDPSVATLPAATSLATSTPAPAPRAILPRRPAAADTPVALSASPARQPITLVVPLFNEEETVDYLHRTLADFRRTLSRRYRVHVILVDDGSRDRTWERLQAVFGEVEDCQLVRHATNLGVAAAIKTGIAHASTPIVCSIDCDCSYDPHELAAMLPLVEDADLVTASPYHPEGRVLNVPSWRLLLSKSLSRMYSAVLGGRIHTYTSCCRVYRKSVFEPLPLQHGGFLGVAEMLIAAKLAGARIVEHPATLEARLFGESKMKVLRTIRGHLGQLRRLVVGRLRHGVPDARLANAVRD